MDDREIADLRERIRDLERQSALLKKERDFFRRTPTLAQGLKGETLIANLTGGVRTGYKDSHDITINNGAHLEVKYSHINVPSTSKTTRWNWHSPLGISNNKEYEYLVLVGEKDPRYEAQYPADLPSVCFLVPRRDVEPIMTGKDIALSTNLETVRARKSEALKRCLVVSADEFTRLLDNAEPRRLRTARG